MTFDINHSIDKPRHTPSRLRILRGSCFCVEEFLAGRVRKNWSDRRFLRSWKEIPCSRRSISIISVHDSPVNQPVQKFSVGSAGVEPGDAAVLSML